MGVEPEAVRVQERGDHVVGQEGETCESEGGEDEERGFEFARGAERGLGCWVGVSSIGAGEVLGDESCEREGGEDVEIEDCGAGVVCLERGGGWIEHVSFFFLLFLLFV